MPMINQKVCTLMRKRVFPRIVWIILLNCVIFILLVMLQFTRRGNFSQKIGDMVVNGRYDLSVSAETESEEAPLRRRLAGEGLNVFFGGLEFRFDAFAGPDTGFCLVDAEAQRWYVFPEYITVTKDGAVFTLPGAAELSFVSYHSGGIQDETPDNIPELRISGKFSDDVSAIEIPFRAQRSSVIRDNGNDTMTISYNGSHYQFSQPSHGLETGRLILSAEAPAVSYGVITDNNTKEFSPADFTVPQAELAETFSDALSQWISVNFDLWGKGMTAQTDEDTVVAWCAEAVRQGSYRSAVSAVPVSFSSHPQRSWESAVYQFDRKIGVWAEQVYAFGRSEREKSSRISRAVAEKDSGIFTEPHLVEFLAIRSQERLLNDLLAFSRGMDPSFVTLPISAGILEACLDMNQWRPDTVNPFEPLTRRICQLVGEGLYRAGEGEQVFVFANGRADTAFNLRLGKALNEWAEQSGNEDWAKLGRTLILSVISLAGESSSVPASLEIGTEGELIASAEQVSTASLYRLLNNSEYLPHATTTGTSGIWAWTAASSINVTQNERMMDIAIRFPVGETHYVMLRNVKPFTLLRIYGMDWRRAYDFESYYNSSGWYYFEREQALILKISHRSNTENVRVYFTTPRPDPVVQPQGQQTGEASQE
jgi:hypothetical protein